MSPRRSAVPASTIRLPAQLPERLRSRRAETEEALLARMRSVADPAEVGDADYVHGLREAVCAALEHAIGALEISLDSEAPLPLQLAGQARLAARRGVGLEVVIRRYVAGHALLCQFILREAGDAPAGSLEAALRTEAALLDRVIAEISDAYARELRDGHRGAERRRAELVRRLLAGELEDASQLGYDLDLWHLGAVVTGPGGRSLLRELADPFERRLLLVPCGREETWAWLGGPRRLGAREVAERARSQLGSELALAVGEPGRSLAGWRLTHRQAKLALPIARCSKDRVVSYSNVALLASILQDELLVASMRRLYLEPLSAGRDGGAALRETLRAYFAAGRSVASAAAALGITRQTVARRLGAAERRLGRSLDACGAEVEIALRLPDHAHRGTLE